MRVTNIPRITITPPEPRTEQESLFRAVQTVEKHHIKHQVVSHTKGSALLLNLLQAHGTLVTDVKQLANDDIFVVHRKRFDAPHRIAHGFFGRVFDVMGDSYALITYEVISEPRNAKFFHKYASMQTPAYPDMGVYSSNNLYKEASLAHMVDIQVAYKLNITIEQLESAITELTTELIREDGHVFYGKTYDCNRFMYDVLRRVYK